MSSLYFLALSFDSSGNQRMTVSVATDSEAERVNPGLSPPSATTSPLLGEDSEELRHSTFPPESLDSILTEVTFDLPESLMAKPIPSLFLL